MLDEKKILRRLYLNQIIEWCMKGTCKGKAYTKDDVTLFLKVDVEARNNISEIPIILGMLEKGVNIKIIEEFCREALNC